jgi:hypothetical protein
MRAFDRRGLLKTTGAGTALALGAGTASAAASQESVEPAQEVVTTFTATGTGGFIAINEQPPDPETKFDLPGPGEVDNEILIEGEVYDDGTWESTNTQFPNIPVPDEVIPDDLPDLNLTVIVTPINTPYTGELTRAPGEELLTVEGTLEIDVDVEGIDLGIEPIEVTVSATTETSNNLEGAAVDFQTTAATTTVVDNEFTIDDTTGLDSVDNALGLPSTEPGTNWFKLDADLAFTDEFEAPIPQPPELPNGPTEGPPQPFGGSQLYEDVTGSGTVNLTDVQVLFENLDAPEVQNNAQAFNFSGFYPDEVTILDVQALYERQAGQQT